MTATSELIKTTYFNEIGKLNDDLQSLSKEQCIHLIGKLSIAVDAQNEILNSISDHPSLDVYSHPVFKMMLEQNDMLVKTLCTQKQSAGVSMRTCNVSASSQTNLFKSLTKNNCSRPVSPTRGSTPKSITRLPLVEPSSTSTPARVTNEPAIRTASQTLKPISVTVLGSSITRDLKPGTVIIKNIPVRYHIRTVHGCRIEQMTKLLQKKQFKPSQHFVVSVGSVNLKHDSTVVAIEKTKQLIAAFNKSYPDSTLALTTVSPIFLSGSKDSYQTVNRDIESYNEQLNSLVDTNSWVEIIKIKYTREMIDSRDCIHLHQKGTDQLSRSIDDYFDNYI
ncbi:unnamed protein product [Didymodactylos carnosus]|uniref:Uncharacterized protein n=1 Tax=Didymodactylos carnosus TaxID=1234261 RepID=A0A815H2R5_9BILA|nr:unnamed protein product [Didymodactylos carnosus]CAF4212312.1 unnamed protein product [Didymodactylos carnosus]